MLNKVVGVQTQGSEFCIAVLLKIAVSYLVGTEEIKMGEKET